MMRTLIVSLKPTSFALGRVRAHMRSLAEIELLDCVNPDGVQTAIERHRPELIAIITDAASFEAVFPLVAKLRKATRAALLVVGPATDAKLILRILHAGVASYLDEDEAESELDSALSELRGSQRAWHGGSLTAVLSASGGCGATTLALNLAALLAKDRGRCNLIDLNPGRGDLAPLLDLKPSYTVADLCRNEERLDASMYEKLLTPHPTGVALLAAPKEFEDIRSLTAGSIGHGVEIARSIFPEVVVDLADCFHDEQVQVLSEASRILLVCRLDFTCVRNLRRVLDHLASCGIGRDRIEIVVNQYDENSQLPRMDAQAAIKGDLSHFVPYDPRVINDASNAGIPAVLLSPQSVVCQNIAKIVGLDTPVPVESLGQRLKRHAGQAWASVERLRAARSEKPSSKPNLTLNLAEDTKASHAPVIHTVDPHVRHRAFSA